MEDYGLGSVTWVIIGLCIAVIVGTWMVFTKAGKPGWASIIPIYNIFVLVDIAGKPWWWVVLLLIPIVNIIALIIVSIALAERFGKGPLYGLGIAIFGFIFLPLLGFGDAQYTPAPGG